MKKGYILAHDLGTTGNKATLYDSTGKLIASSFQSYVTHYPGVNLLFAFIITSRNAKTLPPSALTFMTEAQVAWNEVGGAAIVISIPMILFAMLVQKHLVRGLTMGAIRE